MNRIGSITAIVAIAGLIGCTSMTPKHQGMTGSALFGAVAGAGIAAIAGESAWAGAAAGAIAGGITGRIKANTQQ